MRTTVDIDKPILEEVKRIRDREGKSLGRVISDLLAQAIAGRTSDEDRRPNFRWKSRRLGARVPLEDKDLLYRMLDGENER
jgi:hypothetical protein